MSKQYGQSNIADLQKKLDTLIARWTAYINAGEASHIKYVYSVQIIIIADPYREYTSECTDVEENKKEIKIYVPSTFILLPVIHEIGHYIGCRQRSKRLDFLIESVINWHIRDIYLFGYYSKEHETIHVGKVVNQPNPKDEYLVQLITLFDTEFIQSIKTGFWKEFINGEQNSNAIDHFVSSYSMRTLIGSISQYVFSCICEKMKTLSEDYITLQSDLVKMIQCNLRPDGYYLRTEQCILDIHELFSEPTADTFVLKITGLDCNEYLDVMLSTFYDIYCTTITNKKCWMMSEMLDNWMHNPLLRVLSICFASYGFDEQKSPDFFSGGTSWWAFPVCFKRRFLYRMKKILKTQSVFAWKDLKYREENKGTSQKRIQQIFNPFDLIYDYVQIIWDDPRYRELLTAVENQRAEGSGVSDDESLAYSVMQIRELI